MSGRGRSDVLLFLAPAAIIGVWFLWAYGDPMDLVRALDIAVLKIVRGAATLFFSRT